MSTERRFRFVFEVFVPPASAATQLWVPRPLHDAWQSEERARLPEEFPTQESTDPLTGNRMVHLVLPPSERPTELELSYEVTRRERAHRLPPRLPAPPSLQEDPKLAPFLRPNRKVPLDGPIQAMAQAAATLDDPPVERARKLFEHLLGALSYDAGGCTPERADQLGDLPSACDLRRGTCTEFHGLFVGCARALRIPAQFCFGFNLPRETATGRVKGYHCWSEIWLPESGWLPVDVSEAWKRRDRADFYFGGIDCDRIAFAYGRDVDLAPRQRGEPLDKWIFPYAEVDGRAITPHLGFRVELPDSK